MKLYNTHSDEALLNALKVDDESAFREIYQRFSGELSDFASRLTDNKEDANDVVQEVFINIWKNRESLHIYTSLRAYLFSSVRYGCLRMLEFSTRRKGLLESLASFLTPSSGANRVLETRELENQLDQIVQGMPDRMRTVYMLSREDRLSHKEIGKRLNISEETSKKQVKKALRLIRLQLGRLAFLSFFFR